MSRKLVTFKTIGAMVKAFRLGKMKGKDGRVIFNPPAKRGKNE